MPYGRKKASRKKRLKRTVTESSSSARTVAKTSMTGIWTTPNSSTRPTPCRNDGVGEHLGVVGQAGEHRRRGARPEAEARDVDLQEALVDRVPDRQQEEQREQHAEGGQEHDRAQPARPRPRRRRAARPPPARRAPGGRGAESTPAQPADREALLLHRADGLGLRRRQHLGAGSPSRRSTLPKPSCIWVKVVLMIGPHWKLVFTSLPPAWNTCQMFWPP